MITPNKTAAWYFVDLGVTVNRVSHLSYEMGEALTIGQRNRMTMED